MNAMTMHAMPTTIDPQNFTDDYRLGLCYHLSSENISLGLLFDLCTVLGLICNWVISYSHNTVNSQSVPSINFSILEGLTKRPIA